MIRSSRRVWAAVLLALWGQGFGGVLAGAAAEPLRVAAASSLADALREINAVFMRQPGREVELTLGGSNVLVRQIAAGAPADVLVAADAAGMEALAAGGLIAAGTRVNLLSNTLVLVVPAGSPLALRRPADLAEPGLTRFVTGDPRAVPVGIYAKKYFESVGLWERLKTKLVAVESARAALAAVGSGNIEAGIVYRTDALVSKKVRVAVEIPAAQGPRIIYPAAVLKDAAQPALARRYLDLLRSTASRVVFEKFGFIVLGETEGER